MPIGSGTHLPPFNRDVVDESADWWPSTLLRDMAGASIGAQQILNWSYRIYDAQSVSEDTPIFSSTVQATIAVNYDGSRIISASLQTGPQSRHPLGFTFRHQVHWASLIGAAHGGHTYLIQYAFQTASGTGLGTIVFESEAAVQPRF